MNARPISGDIAAAARATRVAGTGPNFGIDWLPA
jgi:hypothetical protein